MKRTRWKAGLLGDEASFRREPNPCSASTHDRPPRCKRRALEDEQLEGEQLAKSEAMQASHQLQDSGP